MVENNGHESEKNESSFKQEVVKSLSVFFPCYNEQENVARTNRHLKY